jgi:heptosyltransferase-1
MHPAVRNVLPLALRRLKARWWSAAAWRDLLASRSNLAERSYDRILDTQGLIKSAWAASWADGPVAGYSAASAREPLAARFYDQPLEVARDLHAVTRNRLLAGKAFGYVPAEAVDYGLSVPDRLPVWVPGERYAVFLHATSRASKMWPRSAWIDLGTRLQEAGLKILLPWGDEKERETSEQLAQALRAATVPPRMTLTDAAAMLGRAAMVVGVDTGLAHLAVALGRPTIGIYTTTRPQLTGLFGAGAAINLGGGCEQVPAMPDVDAVWQALLPYLGRL